MGDAREGQGRSLVITIEERVGEPEPVGVGCAGANPLGADELLPRVVTVEGLSFSPVEEQHPPLGFLVSLDGVDVDRHERKGSGEDYSGHDGK